MFYFVVNNNEIDLFLIYDAAAWHLITELGGRREYKQEVPAKFYLLSTV